MDVDDKEAIKLAVIENVHRKDNEGYELAEACKIMRGKLLETKGAMKKYEMTSKEIAEILSLSESTVKDYLLADEVVKHSRVDCPLVKDYRTFRMIHVLPKKEWKEASEYVITNNISRADFDKKIDLAEKVRQRIDFLEITHLYVAKMA